METKKSSVKRVAFMAGNDDFRAARLRCALACEQFNKLKEDAPVDDRVQGWLRIVEPNDEDVKPPVNFSSLFSGVPGGLDAEATTDTDTKARSSLESQPLNTQGPTIKLPVQGTAISGTQKHESSVKRPTIPYIKTPIHIDYGLRVYIAPTTFINRNCTILDTPVADIIIGKRCALGSGVTIISVGHPVRFEDRCESETGKPGSWGAKVVIGDGVWIGADVTILPGVTVGSYSTIGAGSVIVKDIPPRCVATGNPATVRYVMEDDKAPTVFAETAYTLEEALKVGRGEDDRIGVD